jgi:PleD family two-component response regulator
VQLVKKNPVDYWKLIIIKQKMPLMDGFRLCQVLREHLDQVQEGDKPMIYSFQPKDK